MACKVSARLSELWAWTCLCVCFILQGDRVLVLWKTLADAVTAVRKVRETLCMSSWGVSMDALGSRSTILPWLWLSHRQSYWTLNSSPPHPHVYYIYYSIFQKGHKKSQQVPEFLPTAWMLHLKKGEWKTLRFEPSIHYSMQFNDPLYVSSHVSWLNQTQLPKL